MSKDSKTLSLFHEGREIEDFFFSFFYLFTWTPITFLNSFKVNMNLTPLQCSSLASFNGKQCPLNELFRNRENACLCSLFQEKYCKLCIYTHIHKPSLLLLEGNGLYKYRTFKGFCICSSESHCFSSIWMIKLELRSVFQLIIKTVQAQAKIRKKNTT